MARYHWGVLDDDLQKFHPPFEAVHSAADVIDADGRTHAHVLAVDTATGFLRRHITDENGVVVLNRERTSPLVVSEYVPAPVTVTPIRTAGRQEKR